MKYRNPMFFEVSLPWVWIERRGGKGMLQARRTFATAFASLILVLCRVAHVFVNLVKICNPNVFYKTRKLWVW